MYLRQSGYTVLGALANSSMLELMFEMINSEAKERLWCWSINPPPGALVWALTPRKDQRIWKSKLLRLWRSTGWKGGQYHPKNIRGIGWNKNEYRIESVLKVWKFSRHCSGSRESCWLWSSVALAKIPEGKGFRLQGLSGWVPQICNWKQACVSFN